jgi:hypothetical protein
LRQIVFVLIFDIVVKFLYRKASREIVSQG